MSTHPAPTLRSFLLPAVRPIDLARQAGVSRQYVSAVLSGQRRPSDKLIAAAAELGLPVHLFTVVMCPDMPAVAGSKRATT